MNIRENVHTMYMLYKGTKEMYMLYKGTKESTFLSCMHTIRGEGGGKEGLKSKRDLIQRQKRPDKEAKET